MEFQEVIRRRHMTRNFDARSVTRALIEQVVGAGVRSPTAGFSQGCSFLILDEPPARAAFWECVHPQPAPEGGRWAGLRRAPVLIVPLADKQAYLDRYAEPDKAGLGMAEESGWPAPYWEIDAAFATMSMLLAATAAGLGVAFFAIGRGKAELLDAFSVPAGRQTIGALALGWPGQPQSATPSAARPRRTLLHWGQWGASLF
jgi:nitroreductase